MAGEASWVVEIGGAPAEYWKEKAQLWKEKAEQWKKRCIYKVPAYITDMNPKAYLPRVVSFGPYHHDKEYLKPMEEHKERALVNFINRSGKPFKQFVEAMSKVLDNLMACYDPLDQKWRDHRNDFLRLMILDGCFMLEIMRTGTNYADAPDDPIFGKHGKLYIVPHIQTDMLMLENQLPMLALDTLVAVESDSLKDMEFINQLIFKFYFDSGQVMEMGKRLHVLDVIRKCFLHEDPTEKTRNRCLDAATEDSGDNMIRSATELHEAGVQFKISNTTCLTDVSFSGGILRIPAMSVDDNTEFLFLNLIAFERFHVGIGNEVSSYVWFMDEIIDNDKDVALLQSKGIIENALGSDKEMADLFNSLARDVSLDPESSLRLVHKEVGDYSKRPWNKWKANLRHTYFRSPWTTASLIAAILLFTLAILQTTYTILQYYD